MNVLSLVDEMCMSLNILRTMVPGCNERQVCPFGEYCTRPGQEQFPRISFFTTSVVSTRSSGPNLGCEMPASPSFSLSNPNPSLQSRELLHSYDQGAREVRQARVDTDMWP
jgi:hypothetical protein